MKKTKRSEKEVDIRPMIYDMHMEPSGICMQLAAGSENNLKPDLVMETFLKYVLVKILNAMELLLITM